MTTSNGLLWPKSQGQTSDLIRQIDWSTTSLGAVESWPAILKTSVSLCLDSSFPMYIWWGEDFINIYNDAYIALAGSKNHPKYFGKPAQQMWSEIWPTLEGFISEVKTTGKALVHYDLLLPLERAGKTEEAYFTFNFGPLRDEFGEIKGVQCTCFETTDKVLSLRNNETSDKELHHFFMQAPVPMIILLGKQHRFSIVNQPYERLIGKKNIVGRTVTEVFEKEDVSHFLGILDNVYATGVPYIGKEMFLPLVSDSGEQTENWIDLAYHPYRDERGKIQGILAVVTDVTEQVKSKRVIEKSHKEFQEVANYMPQNVWTAKPDGSLDYFNEIWFKYSGSTFEDNEGTKWAQFVHPEDLKETASKWKHSLDSSESYTNEFRLKRYDGEYRWHIARAYPIKDADQKVIKWIGTNTDIHDTKTFSYKLESEKLKFETLFADAATSMALLQGSELIFENVNPSYDQLFNNRVKIGVSITEALPELIGQAFPEHLRNVFETGVPYRDDEALAFLRRSDDSPLEERYFRQTYTRVVDANGKPYGVFIHAIEVTNEVMARIQLEQNRNRLNLALGAAHMGTWHIDLKTMEVATSDEFQKIFENGFVGGNIFEEISRLMHPEDVAEVNEVWQKAVTDKTPYIHEYRIVTDTGKIKWVHSRGQATYNKEGKPLTLSGVLMDITSKRLADQKLASLARDLSQAVATRDEFMSIASHELKTPLTSMRLQTQSMQRNLKRNLADAISPERVTRLIDNNDKQVTRLIRLVDDMLDVSRIESGKLSMNYESANLKDIVTDVYTQLKEQIENAGCPVSIELSESCIGHFDRSRIEQVLTNLMTNAMRYGKGKLISMTLFNEGKRATIKIKDQGMGIAPENCEKIFGRFERIISPQEINGLGLGLFITKQIVQAHRGRIWVESKMGSGSTFIVELPLV